MPKAKKIVETQSVSAEPVLQLPPTLLQKTKQEIEEEKLRLQKEGVELKKRQNRANMLKLGLGVALAVGGAALKIYTEKNKNDTQRLINMTTQEEVQVRRARLALEGEHTAKKQELEKEALEVRRQADTTKAELETERNALERQALNQRAEENRNRNQLNKFRLIKEVAPTGGTLVRGTMAGAAAAAYAYGPEWMKKKYEEYTKANAEAEAKADIIKEQVRRKFAAEMAENELEQKGYAAQKFFDDLSTVGGGFYRVGKEYLTEKPRYFPNIINSLSYGDKDPNKPIGPWNRARYKRGGYARNMWYFGDVPEEKKLYVLDESVRKYIDDPSFTAKYKVDKKKTTAPSSPNWDPRISAPQPDLYTITPYIDQGAVNRLSGRAQMLTSWAYQNAPYFLSLAKQYNTLQPPVQPPAQQ